MLISHANHIIIISLFYLSRMSLCKTIKIIVYVIIFNLVPCYKFVFYNNLYQLVYDNFFSQCDSCLQLL